MTTVDRIVLPSTSITVDDFFFTKGTQAKRLLAFVNYLSLGYIETCNAIVKQMHVRTTRYITDLQNNRQNPSSSAPPGSRSALHKQHPEWYKIDNALLPVFRSLVTALEVRSLSGISDWGLSDVDGNPLPVPPITAHFRIAASPLVPSPEAVAFNLLVGNHNTSVVMPNSKSSTAASSINLGNILTHAPLQDPTEASELDRRQIPVIISTLVRAVTNCVKLSITSTTADSVKKVKQAEAAHRAILSSLTNFILDHDADSLGTLDFSRFAALAIYVHLAHYGNREDEAMQANPGWHSSLRLVSLLWHFTKSFVSNKSFEEFFGQLMQTDRNGYEAKVGITAVEAPKVDTPFNGELLTLVPPLRQCAILLSVFGKAKNPSENEPAPFAVSSNIFTIMCPMNHSATPEDISFTRSLIRASSANVQVFADQLDHIRFTKPEQCPFTTFQRGKVIGDVDISKDERIAILEAETWKFFTSSSVDAQGTTTFVDDLLSQPSDVLSLLLSTIRKHIMALNVQEMSNKSGKSTSGTKDTLQPIFPFLKKLLDIPRNHHLRPFVCHQLYFNHDDAELQDALFLGPLGNFDEVNGKKVRAPLTLEDHSLLIDYLSGDYFNGLLSTEAGTSNNDRAKTTAKKSKQIATEVDASDSSNAQLNIQLPKGVSSFVTHPCYEMHITIQHYVKVAGIVQKSQIGQVPKSSGKSNPAELMLKSLIITQGDILTSVLRVNNLEESTPDAEKKRLGLVQQLAQYLTSTLSTLKNVVSIDDEKTKGKTSAITVATADTTKYLIVASPAFSALMAQQLSFLRAIQLLQSVSKFISQRREMFSEGKENDSNNSEPLADPKQWKSIAASFSEALGYFTKFSSNLTVDESVTDPAEQQQDVANNENGSNALAEIIVELILTLATDQILLPALLLKQKIATLGDSDGQMAKVISEAMALYCSVINEMETQLSDCITPRVLSVLRIVIFRARQLVEQSGSSAKAADTSLIPTYPSTQPSAWDIATNQTAHASAVTTNGHASPEQLLLNAFSASPFEMLIDALVPTKDYDRAFKIITHLFSDEKQQEEDHGNKKSIRSDSVLLFAFVTSQLDSLRRDIISLDEFLSTMDDITDLLLTKKSEDTQNIIDDAPLLVCRPELWMHSPMGTQALMEGLVEEYSAMEASGKNTMKSSLLYTLQQMLASVSAAAADMPEADEEKGLSFAQFASMYLQPHVDKRSLVTVMTALTRAKRTASAASTAVVDFIESIGMISQAIQGASRGYVSEDNNKVDRSTVDPSRVWKPAYSSKTSGRAPNYLLEVAKKLAQLANTIAALPSNEHTSTTTFVPSVDNILAKSHSVLFDAVKSGLLGTDEVVTSIFNQQSDSEEESTISPIELLSIVITEYVRSQFASETTVYLHEEVNVVRTIENLIVFARKQESSTPSRVPQLTFAPVLLITVSSHVVDYLSIFAPKLAMKDEEIEALSNQSISSPHLQQQETSRSSKGLVSDLSEHGIFQTFEAQSALVSFLFGLQRSLAVGLLTQRLCTFPSVYNTLIPQSLKQLASELLAWKAVETAPDDGFLMARLRNQDNHFQLVDDAMNTQAATLRLAHLIAIPVTELARNTHRTTSAFNLSEYLFSIIELVELQFVQSTVMAILQKSEFDCEDDEDTQSDNKFSKLPSFSISRAHFAETLLDIIANGLSRVAARERTQTKDTDAVSAGIQSFLTQFSTTSEVASRHVTFANAVFTPSTQAEISSAFISPLMNCIDELHYRCKLIIPTTSANVKAYLRFTSSVPYATQLSCIDSTITAFYYERQRLSEDEEAGTDETVEEFLEQLHSRSSDIKRAVDACKGLRDLISASSASAAVPRHVEELLSDPIPFNIFVDSREGQDNRELIPALVSYTLETVAGVQPQESPSGTNPDALKKLLSGEGLALPNSRVINDSPTARQAVTLLTEFLFVLRLALPSSLFGDISASGPTTLAALASAAAAPTAAMTLTPTTLSSILRQAALICARLKWVLIQAAIPQICQEGTSGSKKFVLASQEENKSHRRRELRLLENISDVVNNEFTIRNAQGGKKLSFVSIYKALTTLCEESSSVAPGSPSLMSNSIHSTESTLPFTCISWELVDLITTSDNVKIETQYRVVQYLTNSTLLRPIFIIDQHWDKTILGLDMMKALKERQVKEKELVQLYKKACEERKKLPSSSDAGRYDDEDEDEDESDLESDDEEETIDSVFGRTFASEPLLLVENLLMCQRIADVAAILPLIQNGRERECDRLLLKYAYKAVDISPYEKIPMNEFPNGKKIPNGSNGNNKGGSITLPLRPPKLKCWIAADATPSEQDAIRKSFSHANTPNMPLYRQIVRICFDQEAAMEASFSFAERLFNALGDYQNNVTKVVIIDTAEHVLMSLPHRTERHVRLLRMFQISRHLVVCNWPDHPQQDVFDSKDEVMNLISKLLGAEHTKAAFSIAEVCGVDIGGVQTLWTDRVQQLLELGLYPEAEAAMAHLAGEKVKEMISYIKNSLQITPVVCGYRAQRNATSDSSAVGSRGSSQKYSVKLVSDSEVPNILSSMRNGIASLFKKYGSRMDLLEYFMQLREYVPAIGIALECRKEHENEVAEIFVRQSFFTNAMGELRKAMKEQDPTLASLRPLIVLCCKTLEKDAYIEELYVWQKWMHDYARAAHTATVLSKQEVRFAEKTALLKEAEKHYMDAKTQPTLKLPDPPFADDGVELPISRLTPQQLHFSLIQVRLQQQLVAALNANNLDCSSLCLYGDYNKVGEVAQSLLVMGKQALIELAVTIMDSFHVDVMTTMTRATISLLEDKKYEPIEILIDQMKRILSLTPAERNGVLYSMLKVCFDDTGKKAQKLSLQCFTAMSNEGGRRVVSLLLFGKYQQAMNEAIESKDYQSVENVYETIHKMTLITPELQEIVDQTRQWLTRNRR